MQNFAPFINRHSFVKQMSLIVLSGAVISAGYLVVDYIVGTAPDSPLAFSALVIAQGRAAASGGPNLWTMLGTILLGLLTIVGIDSFQNSNRPPIGDSVRNGIGLVGTSLGSIGTACLGLHICGAIFDHSLLAELSISVAMAGIVASGGALTGSLYVLTPSNARRFAENDCRLARKSIEAIEGAVPQPGLSIKRIRNSTISVLVVVVIALLVVGHEQHPFRRPPRVDYAELLLFSVLSFASTCFAPIAKTLPQIGSRILGRVAGDMFSVFLALCILAIGQSVSPLAGLVIFIAYWLVFAWIRLPIPAAHPLALGAAVRGVLRDSALERLAKAEKRLSELNADNGLGAGHDEARLLAWLRRDS